jgi:hypothetical protein
VVSGGDARNDQVIVTACPKVGPTLPHPTMIDLYYKDYVKDFPIFTRATWGNAFWRVIKDFLASGRSLRHARASFLH